jgi:hypothetical protein
VLGAPKDTTKTRQETLRVADGSDSFLSRWSRRKAEVRQGLPAGEVAEPAAMDVPLSVAMEPLPQPLVAESPSGAPPLTPAVQQEAPDGTDVEPQSHPGRDAPVQEPTLTMADVDALDASSNYAAFVSQRVAPMVRNAAMRKLFASEPHFNVMDGLDVYIDDYSNQPLMPKSYLRQMMQARMLGLLDDDLVEQALPDTNPVSLNAVDVGVDASAAPSAEPLMEPPDQEMQAHEDPDMQLQPHDAAGCADADPSPAAAVDPPTPHPDSNGRTS